MDAVVGARLLSGSYYSWWLSGTLLPKKPWHERLREYRDLRTQPRRPYVNRELEAMRAADRFIDQFFEKYQVYDSVTESRFNVKFLFEEQLDEVRDEESHWSWFPVSRELYKATFGCSPGRPTYADFSLLLPAAARIIHQLFNIYHPTVHLIRKCKIWKICDKSVYILIGMLYDRNDTLKGR